MQWPRFQVQANGEDIELYMLKAPPIRIIHSGTLEEIEARALAGLSQEEYETLPGDPVWITEHTPQLSKAHVVAYARMKNRIQAVFDTAAERKRGE